MPAPWFSLVLVTAALATAVGPASVEPGRTVTTTVHKAVEALDEVKEDRTGYRPGAFRHWIDDDQDGCDTRGEVFVSEATAPPSVDAPCTIVGGAWHSYYDKRDHTSAGRLAVDHVVPVAEAWDSGASGWSEEERERYANDLDDPRTLVAVTAAEHRRKGDEDPARWEPSDDGADCRYLAEWTAVKSRWGLSADKKELAALRNLASECPDEKLTYIRARKR